MNAQEANRPRQGETNETGKKTSESRFDNDDEFTMDDVPIELVEGLLGDDASRPKFDLDVDESMLMWKVRRMLHKDDYKKIFDSPRIGEL